MLSREVANCDMKLRGKAFNQGIISLTVTKIHRNPSLSPQGPSPRIIAIENLPPQEFAAVPRRINRELKALSIWALSLAISGCIGTGGIAPQGKALDANTLATDEAIQSAAQDAHWPVAQWWRAYGDRQLDAWVELAVQGSPSLAMAAARVRQARAMAGVVESAESLQINADTTLKRHNWPTDQFYGPGDLANSTTWDNNAALGFSYALDLWGRESNASERAVDLAHMSAAEARLAQVPGGSNVVDMRRPLQGRVASNQDVLAYQPGVYAQSAGNEGVKISIRGSGINRAPGAHGSGVYTMFDGLPLTGPGGTPYELFEPLWLSRAEVLRGANGFDQGALALGGAINYVTHTGYDAAPLQVRYMQSHLPIRPCVLARQAE